MWITKHNSRVKERNRMKHNYSPQAKQRGKKLSKFRKANFLAWDGEGLQLDEETQVYGLLANSAGDSISDLRGLSTEDCLAFLTSANYPDSTIHCCFGASYDVNQILVDVDENTLRELHKGNKYVRWQEYELEYRPRKSFTVRRYKVEQRNGKKYRVFDRKKKRFVFDKKIVLWDVFGFFQKKFVSVLEEWTKGTEYEQTYKEAIVQIKQGKEKRGSFTQQELEAFVLPYCLLECQALRDVMHILHRYLCEAGLVLSRWDGAGAVAAATLAKHDVKRHIRVGSDLSIDCVPERVVLASEYAYFGGWIEAYMIGDIRRRIYHYDLRSAYPSATRPLPSLVQGHWETWTSYGNQLPLADIWPFIQQLPSYWIGHIEWSNGPLYGPGPFSWRNIRGSVSRPIRGRGWQWSPEIIAAHEAFPGMEIKIDRLYYFVPDENNEKPFLFVQEYYDLRAKLKEQGIGMEKVLKLALNSLYGKLAQSLGYNKERGLKPPYHCLVYAGIITSETRAKILRAVMQKPHSIISVATDGIYSLEPLDLEIGPGLGQWEFTEHENMTIIQPGVYWYETQGKESHYYRGFNEGSISRGRVIDAYSNGRRLLPISTTRFITLGGAVGLNDFSQWRKWRTQDRRLDLVMNRSAKRAWRGDVLPGTDIKITRNKVYNPKVFRNNPELLDSAKYEFEWDETWDGQNSREIAEEMFHMELSTDE